MEIGRAARRLLQESQVRNDGGLDNGGPGKGEKWSDFRNILKVKPKYHADGLMWNVRERKSSKE